MTDNTFFDGREGREVHFWDGPSTWTLTGLIREKNSQVNAEDYYKYGIIGGAYGTFLCKNCMGSTQCAIMKVFKQVPFEGSEYATAQQRGDQASQKLDYDITSQLGALNTLTNKGCQSTPRVVSMKVEHQKDTDSVPGGYIVYLLLSQVPGLQFSKAIFWDFEYPVREKIRQAFRAARIDCVSLGVVPVLQNIEHVFWHAEENKAYIIGFRMSEQAREEDVWRDTRWIAWNMAKLRDDYRWYKEKNPHPDMSNWIL
ncbi:hypothetical protein BDV38DRAFT_283767 [Aspergillus pseudotamarii]|uniref:Uncharacterized protein n=1 Tax=Aspergillus pseudotamarii TaxID=132259 RepID=A0A5N6SPD7_ASPPS|nr:uncharacterized protein BDV38DRAFT_283767 [Aspergillus pseudotamarii]KAE8136552.1 hypothetical protein BDV38DRAFT_283767 [Aspergillus pseudotamarii]